MTRDGAASRREQGRVHGGCGTAHVRAFVCVRMCVCALCALCCETMCVLCAWCECACVRAFVCCVHVGGCLFMCMWRKRGPALQEFVESHPQPYI